jgi:hypothetical protein
MRTLAHTWRTGTASARWCRRGSLRTPERSPGAACAARLPPCCPCCRPGAAARRRSQGRPPPAPTTTRRWTRCRRRRCGTRRCCRPQATARAGTWPVQGPRVACEAAETQAASTLGCQAEPASSRWRGLRQRHCLRPACLCHHQRFPRRLHWRSQPGWGARRHCQPKRQQRPLGQGEPPPRLQQQRRRLRGWGSAAPAKQQWAQPAARVPPTAWTSGWTAGWTAGWTVGLSGHTAQRAQGAR